MICSGAGCRYSAGLQVYKTITVQQSPETGRLNCCKGTMKNDQNNQSTQNAPASIYRIILDRAVGAVLYFQKKGKRLSKRKGGKRTDKGEFSRAQQYRFIGNKELVLNSKVFIVIFISES